MAVRCSVFIASSLDNYIATPDGSLDWLFAAAGEGEDYGYEDFISTVDAQAMGRGTYDFIAGIDPPPFGGRPAFVFTHRPPEPRDGITFWDLPPEAAVAAWEAQGIRRVYVDGGSLISAFLEAGLITDMTLSKVPIVLGSGRPLFHPIERRTDFELIDATTFPSGFVNLRYERR